MARVKKFDLKPLNGGDGNMFSAVVNGKFRGLVEKSGRSNYALLLGKKNVTNFTSKKSLEEWLLNKWPNK
ncbi:hypothetical protein PP459_gp156 [Streptomyces phage Wakanda]|uniref:Uncharacterized protein n=2 Tax=Wakandavirus TaxID=3044854 RepID=A0A6G8R376_9CAUD|nr:hypothetical protein PP459_gp156 [Streptomyces phage Wakanda]YP_010652398.1 hypothetical protein PP460_gp160 [Streptomyces phage Muntaha]QIN94077.1 hypothetical protein SEA_WAKANDA_92 [Streptomyces phage Wakanda]QIN94642.1 hypothetical protein SEA_MUNTAHA_94 [Streptomyces phage Muntaha]